MHRFTACAVALGLSCAAPVRAEPAGKKMDDPGHYEYRFDDEALQAGVESAYGNWLKVRKTAPRAMLIRPRASFVMELLESIGKL